MTAGSVPPFPPLPCGSFLSKSPRFSGVVPPSPQAIWAGRCTPCALQPAPHQEERRGALGTDQEKFRVLLKPGWNNPQKPADLVEGDLLVVPVLDVEEHHHPAVLVPAGQDAGVARLDGAAHSLGGQVVEELGVLLPKVHVACGGTKLLTCPREAGRARGELPAPGTPQARNMGMCWEKGGEQNSSSASQR